MKSKINYCMLLCNPNKWFGDKSVKNAEVNGILHDLVEFDWTTGRNSFVDIKEGDLGIIKVGNDHRSKACRTIGNDTVDKLDAGIYAIVEFINKDNGKVLNMDDNGTPRVHFKVVRNLYKENNIIDKENTQRLLQGDFKSFSSKKISEDIFLSIDAFINKKN
ncbi:MAG: hypothetical protein U9R39_00900 [Campylobacterota bacterium]|nr:hypothetical protein [Campylobacterota bacterium]